MVYSDEVLQIMWSQYEGLRLSRTNLIGEYSKLEFTNEKTKEWVCHGLGRRLDLMSWSIERVFEAWPPNTDGTPDQTVIFDATVHCQAFVFNTYGCLDNLAHIWVSEKNVKQKNGKALRPDQVGLGSQYKDVWKSLPEEFRNYLSGKMDWYEKLRGSRHALAHGIPLYIPPGYVFWGKEGEYLEYSPLIREAVQRQDFVESARLRKEQAGRLNVLPIAAHSLDEKTTILYIHYKMLYDFHMIRKIATRLLSCFDC